MLSSGNNFHHSLSGVLLEKGPIPISPGRLRANQIHHIFSIKAGMRVVSVESSLEADFIFWAEANPEIVEICEQPLRIHLAIRKRPFYTFDLMLRFSSSREVLYEIKPSEKLVLNDEGMLAPKDWQVIKAWALENSYLCDFLTEKNIRDDINLIANWRRLLPFIKDAYLSNNRVGESEILKFCMEIREVKISGLYKQFPEYSGPQLLGLIGKLIHQGQLSSDLNDSRLSKDSKIRLESDFDEKNSDN